MALTPVQDQGANTRQKKKSNPKPEKTTPTKKTQTKIHTTN